MLSYSDEINWEYFLVDLIYNSYALKAALWCLYGKPEMMIMTSQLALHMTNDNVDGLEEYNEKGICEAICNVAYNLIDRGDYHVAYLTIGHAKSRFTHGEMSHKWMLCENILNFTHAMHEEKWEEAAYAVDQLCAVNRWESHLRRAELSIAQNDYFGASECISIIMEMEVSPADLTFTPQMLVRAHMMYAEIQSYSCSEPATPMIALTSFLTTLNLAKLNNQDYLVAMAGLHLGNSQLKLGMPTQGLRIVTQHLSTVLTHGGAYDRARGLLLLVKCKIAVSTMDSTEERRYELLNAMPTLKRVKQLFKKLDAYGRMKDVIYLQALLYNELNDYPERNRCAMEIRKLDEKHPTKESTNLLTRL